MTRIRGVHHVQITVPVGAEDEARDFYCRVLGLREAPKPESLEGRGGFWLEVGARQVHIGVENGVDRASTKAHVAYEVADLAGWRERLGAEGVEVIESVPIPGYERLELRDPFGNRIELIEPTEVSWRPELYDLQFADKDYAAEAQRIHELVRERFPDARTLVDVACGTGRHLEVLRRWYDAEGLDATPGMLEAARERLPDVPLHVADMRDFDLGRTFDVVTCLFSSIAQVATVDGLRQAVACMARHLRPDGVLIIEPWDPPDVGSDDLPWTGTASGERLRIAWMERQDLEGRVFVSDGHYLVGRASRVEHVHEAGRVGAFTHTEHLDAFRDAGLEVEHDPEGLIGRGLYIGTLSGGS